MLDFFRGKKYRKENIYRLIVEETRNSLDLEMTIKTIINFVGKELNADRCFLMEYDKQNDRFKEHKEEYLSSPNLKSYIGVDLNGHIPSFIDGFKKGKTLIFNQIITKFNDQELDLNNGSFEKEKLAIEEYKVYSAVVLPIFYLEEFLGDLVVHYVDKKHNAGEDEIELLKTVSKQLAISIYHAKIFEQVKNQSEIQNAILNNIPFMAWLKDKKSVLLAVNNKFAKMCNTTIDKIIGKTDFDFFPKEHAETYIAEDNTVMETQKTLQSEDIIAGPEGEKWHETSKSPVFDNNGNVIGTVGLSWDITERKEAEIELAKRQEKILKYAQREFLLRRLIEKIRSSLDIEKILEFVCEETAKTFGVQRVAITEFSDTDELYRVQFRKEYKTDKDLLGYHDIDNKSKISSWLHELFKTANIYSVNNVQESDAPDFAKNSIAKIGVKSIIAKTITNGNETWGMIVLSEYNNYRIWRGDEKSLLEAISNQLFVAISQAKAYEKEKLTVKRDKIISDIAFKSLSSLDINQAKQIVKTVGNIMKADRCFFIEIDLEKMKGIPISYGEEYLATSEIKSTIGYDFPYEDSVKFIEMYQEKKDIIVFDYDHFQQLNDEQYAGIIRYGQLFDLKSTIGVPLIYMDKVVAILVIDYVKEKKFPAEDELNFLRIMASQLAIVFYQIQLYESLQEKANKEELLRKLFEAMRSSLDINIIKNTIVDEVGKILNADRCVILLYNSKEDYFYVDKYSEYLSSLNEKSFINMDMRDARVKWFIDSFKKRTELAYSNIEEFIAQNNLQNTDSESFLREYNIKSGCNLPIIYADNLLGYIIIHYTNDARHVDKNYFDFLKIIADQIGIVLHQAKLYQTIKINAKREKLIAEIASNALITFDINQIKLIVSKIGIMTKADRCFFVEVDLENFRGKPIDFDGEYLASPDIKTIIGYEFSREDVKAFIDLYTTLNDLSAFDYEKLRDENLEMYQGVIRYSNKFGIKSGVGIPIFQMGKLVAVLAIEYMREKIILDKDELDFLRIIGKHASIAYNQIKLYQNAVIQAEREKINRNIIEILRSSIDKAIIKKLFVRNIGKFFNASQVMFSEYDSIERKYLPADEDSEYLADPKKPSLIGYDWTRPEVSEFIQPLLEKRELNISNFDEYIKLNTKGDDFIKFFKCSNIKSSYNFPVLYQQNLIGFFCLDFMEKPQILSEEDINRIRNMCTQAGIALYHASLYEQAQQCFRSKDMSDSEFFEKIEQPTNEILNSATLMSENELGRSIQIEHLNSIIYSCNQLLELTKKPTED